MFVRPGLCRCSIYQRIGGILLALWLLGFIGHLGGALIHLLLVVAVIMFVTSFLTGRRTV
jgi:hypothetical protein